MDLSGCSAVVFGGASGLGEGSVRKLLDRTLGVTIADWHAEKGQALAQEVGERCDFVQTDVTSESQVQAAIALAARRGPLRVAVNTAGLGTYPTRTVQHDGSPHTQEEFVRVVNVNLNGSFNVLRLAAAEMARLEPLDSGSRGVVVNTSSIAAFDGQQGQIAYAAAKGGIVSLTLPAARDLSPLGIRVNTIAPGSFDTPLLAQASEQLRENLMKNAVFPRRFGRPDEFAALVVHLCENDYINGEVIRIDAAKRLPYR